MPKTKAILGNLLWYMVIGAGAFLSDFSAFVVVLHVCENPYMANVLGICIGTTVSFTLNRKLNFQRLDAPGRRAMRFAMVAGGGMAASSLIIMLLLTLNMDARVAKIIAMLLVFLMQFLINARWTFH